MTIETYPKMNAMIVNILRIDDNDPMLLYAAQRIEELEAEVKRLRGELVSEHSLMIMYSDRGAATRRKLQKIGAITSHEEITNLDAIERLGRKLHDEQVRRDEWEKMYNQVIEEVR